MRQKAIEAYKLARPNGWDFYTGKTINYRGDGSFPHQVIVPNGDASRGICSDGVGHASEKPNDCFEGARIPCSAYRLRFFPVCGDSSKWGFLKADVLEEITDLDTLFGWRYSEAINPVNPLKLPQQKPTKADLELLKQWASVWASVRASVWDSVRDSVGASVWASVDASVWASVWASVEASVWASVRASVGASVWARVRDSVEASVWAYLGSWFPAIKEWKYVRQEEGEYSFQPAVDLWKRGFVASFDGELWRLHSGEKARIVFQEVKL